MRTGALLLTLGLLLAVLTVRAQQDDAGDDVKVQRVLLGVRPVDRQRCGHLQRPNPRPRSCRAGWPFHRRTRGGGRDDPSADLGVLGVTAGRIVGPVERDAVDLVMAKLEGQLRRYKEKIQDHRRTPSTGEVAGAPAADESGDE